MENIDELEKEEIKLLEKYLKEYRQAHNIYMRILAVRMVKLGQSRTAVGEYAPQSQAELQCMGRASVRNGAF